MASRKTRQKKAKYIQERVEEIARFTEEKAALEKKLEVDWEKTKALDKRIQKKWPGFELDLADDDEEITIFPIASQLMTYERPTTGALHQHAPFKNAAKEKRRLHAKHMAEYRERQKEHLEDLEKKELRLQIEIGLIK